MMEKKMMGIPVPVWLAVAAAGLVIGIYLRSRSKPAAAGATTDQGNLTQGAAGGGIAPATNGVDPAFLDAITSGFDELAQAIANAAVVPSPVAKGPTGQVASSGGSGGSVSGGTTTKNPPPTVTVIPPSSTGSQYVAHQEFQARLAAFKSSGEWTAGL